MFNFEVAGNAFNTSTTDDTSTQFSYPAVYEPSAPGVDRIGYGSIENSGSTITMTFAAPVSNLRFHVAELDRATYTFALTGGLTDIALVRGNGGEGDGLQVVGNVVSDIDPATSTSASPSTPPPLTGPRSAFGTVSLNGTYTTLVFQMRTAGTRIVDGGSFTLSSVPEPTAMGMLALGGMTLGCRRRANGMTRRAA